MHVHELDHAPHEVCRAVNRESSVCLNQLQIRNTRATRARSIRLPLSQFLAIGWQGLEPFDGELRERGTVQALGKLKRQKSSAEPSRRSANKNSRTAIMKLNMFLS